MAHEKILVEKARARLHQLGWTTLKYHGGSYSVLAHADLYGYLPDGHVFFAEVKTPNNRITEAQLAFLNYHKERGAITFWFDSMPMLEEELVTVNELHKISL